MTSPSAILNVSLQDYDENAETWGHTVLNGVIERLGEAIKGVVSIAVEANVTLTNTNYVQNQARYAAIVFTGTGGFTITLPGSQQGVWVLVNTCTADLTIEVGAGGSSATLKAGRRAGFVTDGTTLWKGDDGLDLETGDARYLKLAGGTLTGALVLSGAPTVDLNPATKKYVDDTAFDAAAGTLPGQSGNAGKYLTTDGTDASWGTVDLTPYQTKLTRRNVTNSDSPVTAAYGDDISCDSSGGAITINLPAAVAGQPEIVIRAGASAETDNITVEPDGAETILGEANLVVDLNYFAYSFAAKAGAWV